MILASLMPGTDGFTFAHSLRACSNDLPILMISSRHFPNDIKKALLAGADDCMIEPVDEDEMLLRIQALLCRFKTVSERQLQVGHTTLIYDSLTVSVNGKQTILPQKEFLLLYKLLSCPNQIFSRIQLMEDVWGPDSKSTEATVSVHINRLRKRFEHNPDFIILTIRGLGYRACIW